MLIRGGANYSYEQINLELSTFLSTFFSISLSSFKLACCGIKLKNSEHEDICCVAIELLNDEAIAKKNEIEDNFLLLSKKYVSKGAKVDKFLILKKNEQIPIVQSKGVIDVKLLKKLFDN
jgi:hypothetical protein